MAKGHYTRRLAEDDWQPEHDVALAETMETGVSFRVAAGLMNERFPGMNWSRNAVLGRAARKGIKSKLKHGQTGRVKPNKTVTKRGTRPKRAKVAKETAAAPVTFGKGQDVALRQEGSLEKTYRYGRKSKTQIEQAKKGHLPCIVEDKPLTSVPVAICEGDSCQWPTSTDITCMEVCGARVEIGAYCSRHAEVAYRAMPTHKRNGIRHKDDREHATRIDGSHFRDKLDPDGEWLTRQILEAMDDVQVLGDDGGVAPLAIPFIKEQAE